jgi:short-subunit dehydrogenase
MVNKQKKNIIISGATSGIGFELSKQISKDNSKVIALGRDNQKLDILEKEIGSGHSFINIDLKNTSSIGKKLISVDMPIHGFVHCAGLESVVPLKFVNENKFIDIMNLHVLSFIEIIKFIDKHKSKNDDYYTSVVSLSSYASTNGGAMQTLYSASKSALEALSQPLSKELLNKKIRINSVKPGLVNTEMTERWRKRVGISDSDQLSSLQLNGVAQPGDVVNLIRFLLSDKSSFIIGSAIDIDGGGPNSTLG